MKKDFKEFIPIGILDLIGIFSIFQYFTTNYIFTYRQYIGISLILICTILFFINRTIYKYLLGLVLIAGMISIIGFTSAITTIYGFGLEFQLQPFLVFVIYLYIYRADLKRVFEKTESENKINENALKDRFKQKFEKLSDKEIESRLSQKLVPEAIQALTEIQTERK
ncbi:hypothetical protein [Lutibacter maritimus]|jgi:membrane-bound ClpP family serine protease|uniref:Uncharacterized protein n=1 Tax=Lutibacter maritimus TaxID=593133 RepID=A0A1I6SWR4_9FLAO|nr:hypothetical protein [Lutibacter maritimus]SFS81411.1 hypothetical protein SAMN04488006_0178 [Lutibacter maritimus]